MSLATTRERRVTAGNRYQKILNETGNDEFFETKYGGFNEEVNDDDYKEEKEVEDVSDSDISIDENDEVISDQEDEPKKKKRAGLITKAYKEPKAIPKTAPEPVKKKPTISPRKSRNEPFDRKSSRRSTAAKSAATRERLKSRIEIEKKKRKMRRTPKQIVKLTQEQLLDEAKVTEEENLKSLEKFQKMELEKKKVRFVKKVIDGPIIRYHSMKMPDVRKDDVENTANVCERTFITFSNEADFKQVFCKQRPYVRTLYCPYTRHPATYKDPLTGIPYKDKSLFNMIRESYNQLLERYGDRSKPEVAKWLVYLREERSKRKTLA